jgi:hypothetical protein
MSVSRPSLVYGQPFATASLLRRVRHDCLAELKARVSEAKTIIIVWGVAVVVLAQLLPALLKQFGLS